MQLQKLKVSACYESETNPRGKDFEGAQFAELVASVKEKGVLVPVLARPRAKAGKQFEIVAGNRRFRAAVKAGLEEIPAQVQEMTDVEAREAQIVENLQRADIHPLEEGEAYRKLIEEGKNYDLEAVAAKVGKPLSYVRRRLILTNLSTPSKAAYRNGKINGGHAEIVARLASDEQGKALKFIDEREADTADLREWVQELVVKKLSSAPPWKDHEKLVAAAAPCAECEKKKGGDLFGKGAAEQCGDPTCFARRMAAHIELTKQEFKGKNIPLVLVASGFVSNLPKGVIHHHDYNHVTGKDTCDSESKALVVVGDEDVGRVIRVCTNKQCRTHGETQYGTPYKKTPKEIAARKKEVARVKAARAKFEAEILKGLEKVKWPLSEKQLDALLDLVFSRQSTHFQMPAVKRHELKPVVKKHDGYTSKDYESPLRKLAEEGGKEAKLRLVFELLIPEWNPYGSNPNKEVKSL
jgi:ParB family chromosome partitioning protein